MTTPPPLSPASGGVAVTGPAGRTQSEERCHWADCPHGADCVHAAPVSGAALAAVLPLDRAAQRAELEEAQRAALNAAHAADQLREALADERSLVDAALHLAQVGERAPGAGPWPAETWEQWCVRAEAVVRAREGDGDE